MVTEQKSNRLVTHHSVPAIAQLQAAWCLLETSWLSPDLHGNHEAWDKIADAQKAVQEAIDYIERTA